MRHGARSEHMHAHRASKWSSSALLITSAFHRVGAYGSTTKILTSDVTVMPSITLTKTGSQTASDPGVTPAELYPENNRIPTH